MHELFNFFGEYSEAVRRPFVALSLWKTEHSTVLPRMLFNNLLDNIEEFDVSQSLFRDRFRLAVLSPRD